VGDTLFWVNRSDEKAVVRVEGFNARKVRIMCNENLSGDRECGAVVEPSDNTFGAPPQSFGYAQQ
jgi:hypothetical protein